MSCLKPKYNPNPPREWYRFRPAWADDLGGQRIGSFLYPGYEYFSPSYKKGNVLQYKCNSSNLTRQQRYAQIARGLWTNRTKTWGSQSETVSNPNTDILQRLGGSEFRVPNYSLDGTELIKEVRYNSTSIYCEKEEKIVVPSLPASVGVTKSRGGSLPARATSVTSRTFMPPYRYTPQTVKAKVVKNGGNLICGVYENPCTGQVLSRTFSQDCSVSTASDVPGRITSLCWNAGVQTYYPRTKLTYGTSGNKWPVNSKAIVAAR